MNIQSSLMIREQPDLARRVGQMSEEEFQATMTAVGKTGSALHAAMGQMSLASRALLRAMRYSGARVPGSPQVNEWCGLYSFYQNYCREPNLENQSDLTYVLTTLRASLHASLPSYVLTCYTCYVLTCYVLRVPYVLQVPYMFRFALLRVTCYVLRYTLFTL